MRIRNVLLFIIVIISLLSSCEFEFSESNYVKIDDSVSSNIPVVNLSELDPADTLDVFNTTDFSYNIALNDLRLYQVEITLNNRLIYESQNLASTFPVEPRSFPVGVFELTVRVKSNKGNGSLADVLRKDTLVYAKTWKLNVDGQVPDKTGITNIFYEDGTLKINFERYHRKNFKAYYIVRNYKDYDDPDYYAPEEDEIIAVINNRDSTVYTDTNYVGGRARYFIITENQTKGSPYATWEGLRTNGEYSLFQDELPKLSYEKLDNSRLLIKWTKSKYYRNFDYYRLGSHTYSTVPAADEDYGKNDTFAIKPWGIPYTNRFGLSLKKNNFYEACSLLEIDPIAAVFPYNFYSISFDYANGRIYLREGFNILRIIRISDYSQVNERTDPQLSAPFWFEASQNGQYIAGVNGQTIFNYKNKDITLGASAYINTGGDGPCKQGSVSNDGYFSYFADIATNGYSYTYYGLVNLNTDNLVFSHHTEGIISAQISVNGDYFALLARDYVKFYSFDKTVLSEITSLETSGYSWMKFSQKNYNLVYLYYADEQENKIEVRDAGQSFNLVNEFPVQISTAFSYDPVTETICGLDNLNQVYVYDAQSGAEKEKLQSYYDITYPPVIFNGTLFFKSYSDWDNGYTYEIPALK